MLLYVHKVCIILNNLPCELGERLQWQEVDSHPTVIRKYLRYRKQDIYKCNYDFIIALNIWYSGGDLLDVGVFCGRMM